MEAASQKNQGPHLPPPCFPRMELPEETAGLPENPCWGVEKLRLPHSTALQGAIQRRAAPYFSWPPVGDRTFSLAPTLPQVSTLPCWPRAASSGCNQNQPSGSAHECACCPKSRAGVTRQRGGDRGAFGRSTQGALSPWSPRLHPGGPGHLQSLLPYRGHPCSVTPASPRSWSDTEPWPRGRDSGRAQLSSVPALALAARCPSVPGTLP